MLELIWAMELGLKTNFEIEDTIYFALHDI